MRNNRPVTIWEHRGYDFNGEVKAGISVFEGANVDYEREGKTELRITLEDPIAVGIAEKKESWGYFQFPSIYRNLGNEIVVKWNMSPDDVASYGKWNELYTVSSDEGKTWSSPNREPNFSQGFLLNNGDRIQMYTPPALKVEELQMPEPVRVDRETGRDLFYKMNELPQPLQGCYMKRMVKGSTSWTIEQEILNDPQLVRAPSADLFPVVWFGDMRLANDGSIITGIYPTQFLIGERKLNLGCVSFYRSSDEGHTWEVQGRLLVPDQATDPNKHRYPDLRFYEPGFEILSDGSLLCVLRTGDVSPMYISRSEDMGRSWTNPRPFTRNGVLPRLLQLKNGVIVLASGRPGLQIRFCTDGKGEEWTDPFEMMPFNYNPKEIYSPYQETCGYADLLATGSNSFIVTFSDFKYPLSNGEIGKAIKIRHITVDPTKRLK